VITPSQMAALRDAAESVDPRDQCSVISGWLSDALAEIRTHRRLAQSQMRELDELKARCLAAELLVKESGDVWTLHLSEGGCESSTLAEMTERCLAAETRLEHVTRDFDRLNTEEAALRAAARRLVSSLPRCTNIVDGSTECGNIATRAFEHGGGRYCDVHGRGAVGAYGLDSDGNIPEYPRAAPLRALMALLPAEETNESKPK
jgi:hypothetical protein